MMIVFLMDGLLICCPTHSISGNIKARKANKKPPIGLNANPMTYEKNAFKTSTIIPPQMKLTLNFAEKRLNQRTLAIISCPLIVRKHKTIDIIYSYDSIHNEIFLAP